MDLLGIKQVQSSRDTSVGMWVQELGVQSITPRLSPFFIHTCIARSVEGLLHSRHVCLAASVDGSAVPGKVRRRQMGGQRRTLQCLEGGKDRCANS